MTEILDGKHSNGIGLLSPPARSAPDVAVSDISINVQENGTEHSPSKVHSDIKSGISDELKKRILAIRPDELAPSERPWVTTSTEAVKLRLGESGPAANKPLTVHTVLANVVEKAPEATAVGYKKDGVWIEISYMEYYESILKTAKSFLKLGLEAGAGVAILGFNSLEWFLSYMGAIYCSGVAVGVYTTNSPESCQFVVDDSRCNVVCVENAAQLNKILKVRSQLKDLKAIVQWSGEVKVQDPMVYSWADFQKLGEDVADDLLVGRVKMMAPNKCCSLIYTSGTTGNPKGVMISHDNLTWTAQRVVEQFKIRWLGESLITFLPLSHVAGQLLDLVIPVCCAATVYFAQPDALKCTWTSRAAMEVYGAKELTEVFISYLPLSHIAAQMTDILGAISLGSAVYFADADALKGSLGITLREIRPTVFFAVPRVWEKFMEKMQALGAGVTGPKKAIATWAKGLGLRGNKSILNGGTTPWGWTIANVLVFSKVRKNLGLDRCRYLLSGAAPLSKETHDYFLSLNLPIFELYGMSENTGPHTLTVLERYRPGSCGVDMNGVRTVIHEPDADGNGEICMDGRHVFMGYLNNEEKTKETIDQKGILHSGDIGRVDQDGFLYITGRIKELIITAGGENIAPVPIEDAVRVELPCIGNCMLIGDRRKFLSILLALKTEADGDGNPLDKLTGPASTWLESVGVHDCTTVSDIRGQAHDAFATAIQAGVERANKMAVSRAQMIQKWTLLPRDFSIGGGELGPTLKLRRPIVTKMYEDEIEKFYEGC